MVLKKKENEKQIVNTYNLIYGKLFNHETKYLKYRKKIIKKNLKELNISKNNLKNSSVMDIGTGIQTVAFNELGAKKIFHYDLNQKAGKKLKVLNIDIIRLNQKKLITIERNFANTIMKMEQDTTIISHLICGYQNGVEK